MQPLDLSKHPPRSPKVELVGLVMLARTIDKLRAGLPGGNMGVYTIAGFSQRILDAIGVSEGQLREVVKDAQNDEDVVEWLQAHVDRNRLIEVSDLIRRRSLDDVDREKFADRYPIIKQKPELYYLSDVLDADDAEMFSTRR
ncbi:MAG: DUF5069 domain-containing protein [Candidatus Eremiobacteraeota bacterium]|nr:DUF5069 domain-containing protein [Candidatus Eremiobacteraeota bacterium]MBC5826163.1 DUF5069 domain-containing protein [Candidatus Eremiobacteraeota bacterium]